MGGPEPGPRPPGSGGALAHLARWAASEPLQAVQGALTGAMPLALAGLAVFFLASEGAPLERFQASLRPALALMSLWVAGAVPWRLERALQGKALGATLGVALLISILPWRGAPEGPLEASLGFLTRGGLLLAALGPLAATLVARRLEPGLGLALARIAGFSGVAALAALPGWLGDPIWVWSLRMFEPLRQVGDGWLTSLLIVALWSSCQFVGVHGSAALLPLLYPLYLPALEANMAAWARGEPLPHVAVINFFYWAFPGGVGATLPVPFLLWRSRSREVRRVARAAAGLALINLNEPLLYGLPILLNPALLIPFVVGPALLISIDHWMVSQGWVSGVMAFVPSWVPWPLGPWIASGFDARVLILKLAEACLLIGLWAPFLRAWERAREERGGLRP